MWYEDPIRMDNLDALAEFARSTRVPTTASETLSSIYAFRELLEKRAVGIVMLDPGWVGGITASRDIAALAAAYHRPVAPHDCTGPVVLCASTHLSLNAPNALVQESVRAFYRTWYRDLVTALPEVKNGMITVPPGPGLGMELHPDIGRAFTLSRRRSDATSI